MDTDGHSQSTGMTPKEKVEFLTKLYDRMSGLTANADTKAGIILTIHSFWAISYGSNLSKLIVTFPVSPLKLALWGLAVTLVVTFLIFFICSASRAAMVLLPRTQPQAAAPPAKPSLTYYADITRLAGADLGERSRNFRARFDQMAYDDIVDDLVYRINDLARVVDEKYRCAGDAVRRSIRTFFLWAASLIVLIAMNMV
jgi:hypothetical protein